MKDQTPMEPKPVKELIADIKENLSQKGASRQDEISVMQSMLSDPDYEVAMWGKNGIKGMYNPCKDFRSMGASMLVNTTKITQHEANALMENYVPSRKEAESMVNISKEYVNTYLQTDRKLPLGGREKSDISLQLRHAPAAERSYPSKDEKGNFMKGTKIIGAHDTIKVKAPCPSWVQSK